MVLYIKPTKKTTVFLKMIVNLEVLTTFLQIWQIILCLIPLHLLEELALVWYN